MTNKKEIIEMVMKDAWYPEKCHAFVQDGKIFVTDSRMGIVFESCSEEELRLVEGNGKHQSIVKLIDKKNKADIKGNFDPAIVEVPISTCGNCDGTGKVEEEHRCQYCEGQGEKHCDECGNDYECKQCEGTGVIRFGKTDCTDCDGSGKYPGKVTVSGVLLGGKYLNVMKKLDGCKLEITEETPLWFVFDGGYGAVMPMIDWEKKR